MEHPSAIRPEEHATFRPDKMGKSTLFSSERLLVGLNCFEPGQEHSLHAHAGMDKLYVVVSGAGEFLLEGRARPDDPKGQVLRTLPMAAGQILVAPEGIPHGIRNTGHDRLVVLAVLAPAPT